MSLVTKITRQLNLIPDFKNIYNHVLNFHARVTAERNHAKSPTREFVSSRVKIQTACFAVQIFPLQRIAINGTQYAMHAEAMAFLKNYS